MSKPDEQTLTAEPEAPKPAPPADPATPPAPDTDEGYPAGTPTSEMTPEQQAAYWKARSRKHEDTAKARADYDDLKAELEQLRAASMTDGERATAEAVAKARADALAEYGGRTVDAFIDARLDADRATAVKLGVNRAAFIDESGDLKLDELRAYLDAFVPTSAPARDPHQGARPTTPGMSGVERGRAEAARRFNKSHD